MSAQERIAKLEALLARVTSRAGEARPARTDGAVAAATKVNGPGSVARALAPSSGATPAPAEAAPTRSHAPLPAAPPVEVATNRPPSVVPAPTTPAPVPVRPQAPPLAASPVATAHVEPEETEELNLDVVQLESVRPPPARPEAPVADDASESRERLVAAPPVEEQTEALTLPPARHDAEGEHPAVASDGRAGDDDAPVLELSADSPDVEVSAADIDVEEPPASSRRTIAQAPAEPPLEELAFGDAHAPPPMPHAPPPESGRQMALTQANLDFESEATGVQSKPDETIIKAPSIPPPASAEAAAARPKTVPPSAPPPPVQVAAPRSVPPAAPAVVTTPEVVRPSLEAKPVAEFVGQRPAFAPANFGELLDATLAL